MREVVYTVGDVEGPNLSKPYLNWRRPLKLGLTLLLLVSAVLFSQSKQNPADLAKCIAQCKGKCTTFFDTCKKKVKTKTDMDSCQKGYERCGATCVNKTCSAN
jgi:hypothetical protein